MRRGGAAERREKREASGGMGKRRNEQPPGGNRKFHAPQTKRSFQEDSAATGDDGLDATGPAQTGDANGKAQSQGQTTRGSAGSTVSSTNGDGEAAAPEQSQAGECVPSPSPQEGRDTGIGGGGTTPEAAAPGAASQPDLPQWVNSALDETEEDQPAATTERHGEELDAETQTRCGMGNIGDSPEHGCAAPARGEGAAGREIALPADTPGSTGVPAEVPDPHREEGGNHSERHSNTDQSQEPPRASVVNAEENESGTALERAAAGEHRETVSGERAPGNGTNDAVKNVAESWCSPAGSGISAEVLGVCAPCVELTAEGGSAEPESTGAASSPGSQGGNVSLWKTSGEAVTGREEAGEGETPSPGTSSVLDLAVPAVGNLAGEREGESLVEDHGAEQPELRGSPEGNGLELLPRQPLPAADRRDAVVPGRVPRAAAGQSRADEAPPLAERNGPAQPQPREDATDVVCGLILELSNLNRLAMSAHRGLEALRKPKARRSRWPGLVPPHAGRRWKET